MFSTRQGPSRRREAGQRKRRNRNRNRRGKDDWWGHQIRGKKRKSVRLSFVNINSIGLTNKAVKNEDLRQFMELEDVDIMGVAEVNVHWDKVEPKDTIWERTDGWFEHKRLGVSYNKTDANASRSQPGGTITLARNAIVLNTSEDGADKSGLGRWSWIKLKGKNTCVTRVVTVYSPSGSGTGPSTVYSQHLAHLQSDPIASFWKDLGQEITEWQENGEQLVLMGDWNEDVQGNMIRQWMGVFGLEEAITGTHPGRAPATYQRGHSPIDGIFVSPGLMPSKAGYLPFGMAPGDHRGIWVDIDRRDIFGYEMSDVPIARARRLKLNDPRVVQRYISVLHRFLVQRNAYSRVQELRKRATFPLTPSQQAEYEDLDRTREEGMKIAEKKCRKFKMGGRKWSPVLQAARDTIKLWTMVRRKLKKCKVSVRTIIRLGKRLKITTINADLRTSKQKLDEAYLEYKKVRVKHEELHRTHREQLAQAKAKEGNTKAESELRSMLHREKQRKTARRVQRAIKKSKGMGTTKVHVNTNGNTREITRKTDMEAAILAENKAKFHQTEGWCPLLEGRLAQDLGLMGDGPKVPEVLRGTYRCPPGTSVYTKKWLKHMKIQNPEDRERAATTVTKFREGWKKINERTASGELHMGHFKAGCLHKEIGWFHFSMSAIPMTTGYSPERWRQGTDVMLLKAPDVYLLEKLRTIVLYEADYNHENKRIGRDAMYLATTKGQIADEQYSRPGRSAQDNAVCKRLVFDYFRFKKMPYGMCACDLKACYDRIVHTAASIALQKVGIELSRIKCMFETVQRLVHNVRTAYGRSSGSYGGELSTTPPQGTGQGNGAAPSIWSILSSTIFQILHNEGYGTTLQSAITRNSLKTCGFSYVDDCDLICTGSNPRRVAVRLQAILKAWDRYMQVTGAAIAPDKCWWYLVDYKWSRGLWKHHHAGRDLVLRVRDKNKRIHAKPCLKPDEAKEMVGVFLSPDGKQTEQLTQLKLKAQKWAAFVKCGRLDYVSTWIALRTTILKTIEYPLAATTLTKKQCIAVMEPILKSALPRSNMVHNFARSVLYGPTQYQGMGLHDPYVTQGIRHVKDIVDQLWKKSISGRLIQMNVEALQLELGCYGNMFLLDLPQLWINTTDTWIGQTLEFCLENKIVVSKTGEGLKPSCQGDSAIMQIMANRGLTKGQLKALNRCRLASQVVSISELATGDGKKLAGIARDPVGTNGYVWPIQGKVTNADWSFWERSIQQNFCVAVNHLETPLGHWTLSDQEYFTNWEWFVGEDDCLYQRSENEWLRYQKDPQGRGRQARYDTQAFTRATELPASATRTTTVQTGVYITHTGTRPRSPPPPAPQVNELYQELCSNVETKWFSHGLNLPQSLEQFVQELYAGRAVGVSDGSYDPDNGLSSAAWIIYTPDGQALDGAGMVPGTVLDHNSYRGELGGLLAQLQTLQKIEDIYPGQEYDVIVACDGESALMKALTTPRDKISSSNRAYDILSRIADIREQLRAQITPVHVEGHADESGREMTDLEVMNCRMDARAKQIMEENRNQDRAANLPPSELGLSPVSVGGVEINSELLKSLRFHIGKTRLLRWWIRKGRMTPQTSGNIHWSVTQGVMDEATFAMKKFMSKWVTGQFGVGVVMEYRKARKDNCCPRCFEEIEDKLHVLQCPHFSAHEEWDRLVEVLQEWMLKIDTHPSLRVGISQVLWNYYDGQTDRETYISTLISGEVRRCFQSQARLGWTQFLQGFLVTDWANTQQAYYKSKGSRRTGRRWAVNLSKQLWRIIFGMWNHRNQEMFNSGLVNTLSGEELLKQAIQRELAAGLQGLLPIYSSYFRTTTRSLFSKPVEYMKQWLVIIRRGRVQSGHMYDDEIARNQTVQKWIGLSK